MTSERASKLRTRARAPKAAAMAGIVFSLLLFASLALLLSVLSGDAGVDQLLLATNQQRVELAINLIPFASIAFLWFVGVVRDRFGEQEDQFFSTVFLGSGLLFIAMLFVSSAVTGSLFWQLGDGDTPLIAPLDYAPYVILARETMTNYGIRMAGVFMISTSSLFLRTQVIPRWLAWLGFGLAAVMILRIGYINRLGWIFLSLPLWVLLLSIYILIDNYRQQQGTQTPG